MRKITIGFSTSRSKFAIGAIIIRIFEGTKFSHTYMEFRSDSLFRSMIYQASHGLVNFMNEQVFDKDNVIIESFEVQVTDDQYNQILAFCIDCAGVKYGKLELIGIGIARIKAKLGFAETNPFSDGPRTFVCSELMGYVLNILGCQLDTKRLEIEGPAFIRDTVAQLSKDQQTKGLQ